MSALQTGFDSDPFSYSYSSKRGNRHNASLFFKSCNVLLCCQILGGISIGILSCMFLFGYIFMTGIAVGVLLIAAGVIGLLGNNNKNRDMINFHIVIAILGIVLCSNFVGQVWREVSVDCALAELSLKTNALDEITKTLANHDMFASIHDRLNELEEMLDIVHYGMESTVSFLQQNPSGDPAQREREYIRRKLEVIRLHAKKVVEEIENHPNATDEKVSKWKPQDRQRLQTKLKTAQKIAERIEELDEPGKENPLTPAEYERMVKALLSVMQFPTVPGEESKLENMDLLALTKELDTTKEVINNIPEQVKVLDELMEDTQSMTDEARKRREDYSKQFRDMLRKAHMQGKYHVSAHVLHNMPEHCVQERKALQYLGFLGWGIALLQLATIYISLCISFRIPIKSD